MTFGLNLNRSSDLITLGSGRPVELDSRGRLLFVAFAYGYQGTRCREVSCQAKFDSCVPKRRGHVPEILDRHVIDAIFANHCRHTPTRTKRWCLRPRDAKHFGIPGNLLARLARQGLLTRIGRGLYSLPDATTGQHHSLAEADKRVPPRRCLAPMALRDHHLTTQAPFEA